MLFACLLIIAIIIASTVWIVLGRKKNVTIFPGPKPFPVIGNILEFINQSDILPKCVRFMTEFGENFTLHLGPIVFFQISDPNLVEKLMNTQEFHEKAELYNFLKSWLGTGLLTSLGEKWQRHRKIITPTFHFQILEKFLVTFDLKSSILVEKLKKHSDQIDFDISPYIYNCTLDIICETAMGISMNIQENSTSSYVQAVKDMSNIFLNRILSPLKQIDILYKYTSDYLLEKKSLHILHTTTEKVIYERKALIDEQFDSLEGKKVAFLDMLFNKGLSFDDIRNEVDTFMFEGHDTTGVALSFIVYCLSINPDIQDKVFEEQQQIYEKDPNIDLTYNILQSMNYLEKVIKETLRLYPSVPLFARKITRDFHFHDFVMKEGTTASIFAFGMHRNPKYFPDPEKFDPERFSPENCRTRSPYVYIPFSAGSRNCIGQKFAMLEMKTSISRLVWNYKFLPCPGFKPDLVPAAVLKSLNGIRVKLVNRHSSPLRSAEGSGYAYTPKAAGLRGNTDSQKARNKCHAEEFYVVYAFYRRSSEKQYGVPMRPSETAKVHSRCLCLRESKTFLSSLLLNDGNRSSTYRQQSIDGPSDPTRSLMAIANNATLNVVPCRIPFCSVCSSEKDDPTRTLKNRHDRNDSMNVDKLTLKPTQNNDYMLLWQESVLSCILETNQVVDRRVPAPKSCLVMLFTYHLIIAIIIASTVWILLGRKKNGTAFPGPKPFPVIGNILELINRSEILSKTVQFMLEFGDNYTVHLGPMVITQICDPNLVEKIVNAQEFNEKAHLYNFLRSWLGTGLLTSTGEKWQRHRKIITPTFHFQMLEKFLVIFELKSLILIEKLKKHSDQIDFDISPYIYNCTLDIICETAMGISMDIQKNSTSLYVQSVKDMSNIFLNRLLSPIKQIDFLYKCTSDYLLEKKSLDILHTTTENVIHKRKALIDKQPLNEKKVAFLDMLFNKGLSFDDIKNEVDTFMFEGHDTTGVALSFIVYCLSINPDIQNKVFAEQQQIYENDPNITLTYNILQSMNYLEKVIKESMRLYPSVPLFARKVTRDFHFNDFVMKEGTTASIFVFGLHRNPKLFPDPEKFDPERFSPENCRMRSPYAYIPFSAGSRNCIGQKFAMLEMKMTISRLIWNYKILPCPGFKPDLIPAAVLKSLNGVRVKLVNRQ
ncbi:PREDICTED: uncharacterized protein LOC108560224 [Nicrophorus vespilloides]|uniref:Uncharacterized protein LOC108560224 n=1 Tax=Nicrophorus vespilloides TaxID=110193 RepID=A0ABM1MF19_NICVS|nr:PREDICTED: uncharacterized protein LOC108560224 [Nicrophorus vespilloides]